MARADDTVDPAALAPALDWLLPDHRVEPVVGLQRIRWLCENVPDLYSAVFIISATHQGVPRAQLAAALRQFRPELRAHSAHDVAGMVKALWQGGKDGFEAVLRTRKTAERRAGAASMAFVSPD